MRLFNTASRQLESVNSIQPPQVSVYTCGPTVYDFSHIGHWFTYVRMDTLIRTLRANGFHPNWVMNITDVGHLTSDADEGEDKLEKGAKREGKTAWEVAEFYTGDFLKSMGDLNILSPSHIVKATDHIDEQISLIQSLETKGYTYIIDDGVYYDTSKFADYGKFAQLDLDEQQAGARIAFNPQKRNPSDFALWKFSPKDSQRDMEWDSPWGKGFPGWHIECSAMSMKYLGTTLDIHTGGIDHIPVHHTNEIAQSEAITGEQYAKYWLHSNHVTVNGEKISKSLGNGIRMQDLYERGYSAEAVRLHILESHYRSQSKFSWESLEAAKNRLQDLYALAALRFQAREVVHDAGTIALVEVPVHITELLSEDLGTPQAMAFLSQVSAQLQTVLIDKSMLPEFEAMLRGIDALLGLKLSEQRDITAEQRTLLAARETAREQKDWQQSDAIRERLAQSGIGLRDTSSGAIWYPL
jgi:cysteinyl-tRNA synthetase